MVAIKDFDMPECCTDCNMLIENYPYLSCSVTGSITDDYTQKIMENCPLVEIKQPESFTGKKAVIDDNEIQIIKGGRLSGRIYAFKCGQQKMKVLMLEKIKRAVSEIESNMESIVGAYDANTPERQLPSRKIERNEGRYQALEILIKLIEECEVESG